mmetsp:Transcript_128852/g.222650  ORF Transcript_128852/g.222650 Transcript_128852/m.222650 type:complete len:205 (-) Transcript_128852:689-1303(-)
MPATDDVGETVPATAVMVGDAVGDTMRDDPVEGVHETVWDVLSVWGADVVPDMVGSRVNDGVRTLKIVGNGVLVGIEVAEVVTDVVTDPVFEAVAVADGVPVSSEVCVTVREAANVAGPDLDPAVTSRLICTLPLPVAVWYANWSDCGPIFENAHIMFTSPSAITWSTGSPVSKRRRKVIVRRPSLLVPLIRTASCWGSAPSKV